MRNVGLKNSNYCMTVVGVALLPLYVTHKILYVGIFIHYTVCNGVDELLKTF